MAAGAASDLAPGAPLGTSPRLYGLLAVFVATLWLAVLPARPLFNPDEGRYAEVPREMLEGGDWVIPHLDGLAYVEKPPLQYWVTALALHVFGINAFAARLMTALSALGALAAIGVVAHRFWGVGAAWRSAAILASLSLYPVLGQLLTLDMSLTFFMTLGLAGFLLAQRPGAGRGPMLVAWAATAAGVLTKGLVAALIPAAVLVLYTLVARDWGVWRRLGWSYGLPLFLALAVPWHWLAARREPDFLAFFFVHEHVARYLTPSADRAEVWWFFAPVFLAGTFPWTLSALRVLATGWRETAVTGEFNVRLFLWIWVVFVLVFFSLSDSKLIPYILPALPALALAIGALPPRARHRDCLAAAALTLMLGVALAAACLDLPRMLTPSDRSPYFLSLAAPLLRVAAVLGVSGAFVLARRRRDATAGAVFLGAGGCIAILLSMRAATAIGPIYSGQDLAAALPVADRAAPIYSVDTYDQTLPFYWRRTVTLVAYRGELDFGLRHAAPRTAGAPAREAGAAPESTPAREQDKARELEEFYPRWTAADEAFAVMEIELFERLKIRGLPMRELKRDLHRVLVARR
jgi:4-amino-4-deoxy-L-arabinose transferase-like glycosyltransferase